jgi:hypothetical protein
VCRTQIITSTRNLPWNYQTKIIAILSLSELNQVAPIQLKVREAYSQKGTLKGRHWPFHGSRHVHHVGSCWILERHDLISLASRSGKFSHWATGSDFAMIVSSICSCQAIVGACLSCFPSYLETDELLEIEYLDEQRSLISLEYCTNGQI